MISKTSIQTINALIELSKLPPGEVEGVARIAQRIKVPQEYLAKLLQGLVRKGVVSSKKGLNGGFSLAQRPEDIRLYEIIGHLENIDRFEGCFLGNSICSEQTACVVHKKWETVRRVYMDFLLNTTIADLRK